MSCEIGHVYVIYTTITKPPKDKITICVCAANSYFLWINSLPRVHGVGQMELQAADHPAALNKDCFLDCSKITVFSTQEISRAEHRGQISHDLAERIIEFLEKHPPKTLPEKHRALIADNLRGLLK